MFCSVVEYTAMAEMSLWQSYEASVQVVSEVRKQREFCVVVQVASPFYSIQVTVAFVGCTEATCSIINPSIM